MAEISHQHGDVSIDDEILKQPLDVEQKTLNSSYGDIKIIKITNNTSKRVQFKNPYYNKFGDLGPGEVDENDCKGYIPYYHNDKKYEISYFNEPLRKRFDILIKDLGGQSKVSLYQEGLTEDIRRFAVSARCTGNHIQLNNDGYEIFSMPSDRCHKAKIVYGST